MLAAGHRPRPPAGELPEPVARTRTAILDAASTYGQEDLDGLAAIGDPTVSFGDDDDLVGFADFGGYLGWRVGIEADGTWSFFVAGD